MTPIRTAIAAAALALVAGLEAEAASIPIDLTTIGAGKRIEFDPGVDSFALNLADFPVYGDRPVWPLGNGEAGPHYAAAAA